MISLCHPHFLFWTETSSTFTFDSPAALLWHFLSCPATEWGCSTAGHISPSPLPPALNQGPPILSLPLCTTLTLSPPSFSLAVSPVALRTESSTALTHFLLPARTCRKRRGGERILSGFDFPHHSACSGWRCVGGVGFLMEWLQRPPPCTICPFWLGHRGNVASLDGWISKLHTLALFTRRLIIISCGRAVRSGVTEAGIRGEKLTPGEFLNELLATSVMEKDN